MLHSNGNGSTYYLFKMVVCQRSYPNDSTVEEEEDVGALIYREVQLRKTEAVAEKKISTASAHRHRRTSTRKRSPVNKWGDKLSLSSSSPKCNAASKRKPETSMEEDQPRKKVPKSQKEVQTEVLC